MSTVTIIDSGGANIASLRYAFKRLGVDTVVTANSTRIQQAERIVLPGVGSADHAMQRLTQAGLPELIRTATQPVLGVCLGLQLIVEASEEDDTRCLGIIEGHAKKLQKSSHNVVPNMGWCRTTIRSKHPLLTGIEDGSYFYYLHSYAVAPSSNTLATATHNTDFAAVIAADNFAAAQFHPERSSVNGAILLKNFMAWSP